jgi:hypothetical protein
MRSQSTSARLNASRASNVATTLIGVFRGAAAPGEAFYWAACRC